MSTSTDEGEGLLESLESSNSDEEIFDFHRGKGSYIERMIGVLIKKFKLSNFAAIMILVAADLGIGYFTLPYVLNMDNIWGTIMLIVNCGGGLFSCYLFIQTCEMTKLK